VWPIPHFREPSEIRHDLRLHQGFLDRQIAEIQRAPDTRRLHYER
jgi:hypothetical protein